ncbi:MAG: hypothetical protein LBT59_02995 [Clostridiales bacterium]|jgi:uncharacterized membrane protein YdjX (TVP38/TMEM64 family)|nr:hypothetical protein [Clostridiales bacterium]
MNGQEAAAPLPNSPPGMLSLEKWLAVMAIGLIPGINIAYMLILSFEKDGNPTLQKYAKAWLLAAMCVCGFLSLFS